MSWIPHFLSFVDQPDAPFRYYASLYLADTAGPERVSAWVSDPTLGRVELIVYGVGLKSGFKLLRQLHQDLQVWAALPEPTRQVVRFRGGALEAASREGDRWVLFTRGIEDCQAVSLAEARALHLGGQQVWGALRSSLASRATGEAVVAGL